MSKPDFKPSQVVLRALAPLAGTMHKLEAEIAAACLVAACQAQGDEWRGFTLPELAKWLETLRPDDVMFKSLNNPFSRPDFAELVRRGYATAVASAKDGPETFELSDDGYAAIRRKWVRDPA